MTRLEEDAITDVCIYTEFALQCDQTLTTKQAVEKTKVTLLALRGALRPSAQTFLDEFIEGSEITERELVGVKACPAKAGSAIEP